MSVEHGDPRREGRSGFNNFESKTRFELRQATPEDFTHLINTLEQTPRKTSITFSPKERPANPLELDLHLIWNPEGSNFIPRYVESRTGHILGRESEADFAKKLVHNLAIGGKLLGIEVDIKEEPHKSKGFELLRTALMPQLSEDGYVPTSGALVLPTSEILGRAKGFLQFSFSRIQFDLPRSTSSALTDHYIHWWNKYSNLVDPRESTAQV